MMILICLYICYFLFRTSIHISTCLVYQNKINWKYSVVRMCITGTAVQTLHICETQTLMHYGAAMQSILYLAKVHRAVLSTGLPFPVWTR